MVRYLSGEFPLQEGCATSSHPTDPRVRNRASATIHVGVHMRFLVGCAFVLLPLLAGSCRTLPDSMMLERWSGEHQSLRINAAEGERRLLRGDDCEADPANARCKGVRLLPGDVLYLRRWWPSTERRDFSDLHWTGPASFTDRIPLRRVDEATGTLYPYERELLATVLTVHRGRRFNELRSADAAELLAMRDALRRNENKLWNTLIGSLRVRALDVAPATRPDQNGIEQPVNFTSPDPNLYLTFRADLLCNELKKLGIDGFFRCEVLHDPDDANADDVLEKELFAREMPYPSPWDAFLGERPGIVTETNTAYYANRVIGGTAAQAEPAQARAAVHSSGENTGAVETSGREPSLETLAEQEQSGGFSRDADIEKLRTTVTALGKKIESLQGELAGLQSIATSSASLMKQMAAARLAAAWSTFNFVEVELAGTSMTSPGDAERRWSLKDWDEGELCRVNGSVAHIDRIVLRDSILPVQIVTSGATDVLTVDVADDGKVTRRIKTKPGACTACVQIHSIDRAELQWLRPSDVSGVLWSYQDANGRKRVSRTSSCATR